MFAWWNDNDRNKAMKNWPTFIATTHSRILNSNNEFKCLVCDGRKTVLADDAYFDPVEGYKFADHVTCSACSGTGTASEKTWKDWFKVAQSTHKIKMNEEKDTEKLKKSALKKLTPDERRALGF